MTKQYVVKCNSCKHSVKCRSKTWKDSELKWKYQLKIKVQVSSIKKNDVADFIQGRKIKNLITTKGTKRGQDFLNMH